MAQVGNININFTVFSDDPQHLTVGDLSDWVYAENLPSYIEILLPGSKRPRTFTFNKKKLNIFNSHNLGLSCLSGDCTEEQYVDLPDGIYRICVKSNFEGIQKDKFYLKTDIFELETAKVLVKYGIDVMTDEFLTYMVKTEGILKVAKSHAMLGDFNKANMYFEEAKKRLKKYVECKDCF